MRLNAEEKMFVRNLSSLRMRHDVNGAPMLRDDDSRPPPHVLFELVRNVVGARLYADYRPFPYGAKMMTEWSDVWPSFSGEAWQILKDRTHHLLWLAARYHQRFGTRAA